MTVLTKFVLWRLVVLIGLFLVAIYAAASAITVIWLSAFPENISRLDALTIKFWSYAVVSAALFVFDLWLLVRTIKHVNRTGS
jgi:hypothetical protein